MSSRNYSSFVLNLISARKIQEQPSVIYGILSKEVKGPISGSDAKAFLIHLALDTFGSDFRSDIVLVSWGLLKGFDAIPGLVDRRMKYLDESGFRIKNRKRTKKETPRTLFDRSRDLIDIENNLYLEIESKWTLHINDKSSFLELARQNFQKEKLPTPSYLTSKESKDGLIDDSKLRHLIDLALPNQFPGDTYFKDLLMGDILNSKTYHSSAELTRHQIFNHVLSNANLSTDERKTLESALPEKKVL